MKVTGEFEVTFRTPIDVSFDFDETKVQSLQFVIDGSTIVIHPLKLSPPVIDDEYGPIESPAIEKIRIWITKDVPSLNGLSSKQLSTQERERFEPIIIEATRRFVTAVKARTRQCNLDHRHPVRCYTSKYSLKDERLTAEFLDEKVNIIPKEDVAGLIIWVASELEGELTEGIWEEVAVAVRQPVNLNHYDEAILDAKTFRTNLRYDTAILYAAFASETILKELGAIILKSKVGMGENQIDKLFRNMNIPSIIELIESLHGLELPRFGKHKLEKLFEFRNTIVHKKRVSGTGTRTEATDANGAVIVAEELRELLHKYQ